MTNDLNGTVSVIHGVSTLCKNIFKSAIPLRPFGDCRPIGGIAVDTNVNKTYVADSDSGIVSVIDANINHKHRIIDNIDVAVTDNNINPPFPWGVAFNPKTNLIYVTDRFGNRVSVINDSIDRVVYNITVGDYPGGVAVNPGSNLVYVTNTRDDTVSVINGTTNKLAVGLNFNINSPSSGSISCKQHKDANTVFPVVWNEIPNNDYLRYDYGTTLDCKADANTWSIYPKIFDSWSGIVNSSATFIPVPISRYGTLEIWLRLK